MKWYNVYVFTHFFQIIKQSKRARKGDKKSLDDDSLVLEEENEDKPAIVARFVEQFHVQKKTSVYSHTCLNLLETTGLT